MAEGTVLQWATEAVKSAEFESLPDGTIFARVPGCPGAVATGPDEREARHELLGVLQDWARLGLELDDVIPVQGGIDLNARDREAAASE